MGIPVHVVGHSKVSTKIIATAADDNMKVIRRENDYEITEFGYELFEE